MMISVALTALILLSTGVEIRAKNWTQAEMDEFDQKVFCSNDKGVQGRIDICMIKAPPPVLELFSNCLKTVLPGEENKDKMYETLCNDKKLMDKLNKCSWVEPSTILTKEADIVKYNAMDDCFGNLYRDVTKKGQ